MKNKCISHITSRISRPFFVCSYYGRMRILLHSKQKREGGGRNNIAIRVSETTGRILQRPPFSRSNADGMSYSEKKKTLALSRFSFFPKPLIIRNAARCVLSLFFSVMAAKLSWITLARKAPLSYCFLSLTRSFFHHFYFLRCVFGHFLSSLVPFAVTDDMFGFRGV